jgi:hypothetical protein
MLWQTGDVMRRSLVLASVLLLGSAAVVAAHDLFLKLDDYFVAPESTVRIHVLNGTFSSSEAGVARERVRDMSVVTPSGIVMLDTTAWSARGDTSVLSVRTGGPGTYVVGASVRPRELRLEAQEFNAYLEADGVPDVLAARRRGGELDRPARERYSKHVKAVLQVGDRRSGVFATPLGHPAELVPLDNPYELEAGGVLRVRALVDGAPVAKPVHRGWRPDTGRRPHDSVHDANRQLRCREHPVANSRTLVRQIHPHDSCGRRHDHRVRVEVGNADVSATIATRCA